MPPRTPGAAALRVAMLAPISWRVPPRHYGPWEQFASLVTEGLVARGVEVTLFAIGYHGAASSPRTCALDARQRRREASRQLAERARCGDPQARTDEASSRP